MVLHDMGFPGGASGKESLPKKETKVRSLGQEDPLEEEMVIYSSILGNPMDREEPGRLQSMVLQSQTQLGTHVAW